MKSRRAKIYYVYIIASISKVVYIGFTDSLFKRIKEHKKGSYDNAFSKKYKVNKLVYWEHFYNKKEALDREREMKKYRREKKVKLIEKHNIEWEDLYSNIIEVSKL
ncbi:GIY-YIG nuclease family protein [Patescibacteria group bacterium]|nr:GIY-YIG nuclease family protein [Patescibacteria group bacterium]